jgi:hypothetical protein
MSQEKKKEIPSWSEKTTFSALFSHRLTEFYLQITTPEDKSPRRV